MKDPIQSAHTHLEAQMSQSVERLRQTTTFPFFHIQPDGETMTFQTAEEIAPLGSQPFKTEIIECEIVEAGEGSAVLRLIFQRYDTDGNKAMKAKAVWGATEINGSWAIHWRQFLGAV